MSYSNEPPNYGSPPPPPGHGGGQPGYGGQPQQNSVMAIISLVLGIVGVIPCFWGCFVFQAAAIVLGLLAKKEIAQSGGAKKGEKQAQWGFILGIVGLVLSVLYWILIVSGALDFNYYSDL